MLSPSSNKNNFEDYNATKTQPKVEFRNSNNMSDRKRHRDEDEDRHNALTREDREGEDEKKYIHKEKKHKKDISDSSESSESSESEHEHKKHKEQHKKT